MLACEWRRRARVRFPTETCLSRGALVEDGDDLGQVSSKYVIYAIERRLKDMLLTEGSWMKAM